MVLVFLLCPLLILSINFYVHQYFEKRQANFIALRILGTEKAEILSDRLKEATNFLNLLLFWSQSESTFSDSSFFDYQGAGPILYLEREKGGDFICTKSSMESFIGKRYEDLFDRAFLLPSSTYFVAPEKGEDFLVFKKMHSSSALLAVAWSNALFMQRLSIGKLSDYPTHFVVLGENNAPLLSDQDGFQYIGQKKGHFYHFPLHGRQIGVKIAIPNTPFSVFVYVPRSANLIPLWRYLPDAITIFLLVLLSGIVGSYFFIRRFVRPWKQLVCVISQVGQGRLKARFSKDPVGYEINQLGALFNKTVDALHHQMQEREKASIEREVLAKELQLGQKVQNALLQQTFPQKDNLEFGSEFLAAANVGGDFYDVVDTEIEEKILLTIADVAGKGISACLYSLSLRAILRSCTRYVTNLSQLVRNVNTLFCKDTKESGVFATAWIGIYDPKTQILEYTNCGHHAALLCGKKGVSALDTKGMALGAQELESVEIKTAKLVPLDHLLLYTDGVVEAHDVSGQMFGKQRLLTLCKQQYLCSAKIFPRIIKDEVVKFCEIAQYDDIAMLSMQIKGCN